MPVGIDYASQMFSAMANDLPAGSPERELMELWDLASNSSNERLAEKLPLFVKVLKEDTESKEQILAKPQNSLTTNRGIAAMMALGRLARMNDLVQSQVKDAWPDVFAWIKCTQEYKCAPQIQSSIRAMCSSLLFTLAQDKEMREIMAETPGLLAMLAKFWVAELDYEEHDRYGLTPPPGQLSYSRILLRFISTDKPKWFDEVHLALGKDPLETSRVTLESIRKRIDGADLDFGCLISDLHILHVFCHWNIMPLRDALFSRHGFQTVQKVMEHLLACEGDDQPKASLCLTFCVKYLIISLQLERGRAWAYRIFDAPILRTILQASIWLTTDEFYLAAALDAITPYMLFRSVLYRAERAAEIVAELGLEPQMDKEGPVYQSFQRFKTLLSERLEVAEGHSLGTKVCENAKCSKVSKSKELMKCGGCKKVFYCSKACQVQSWKHGPHRALCKLLTEEPGRAEYASGVGEIKLLPEDYKLVRKIIHHDITKHSEEFVMLRAKLLMSKPNTDLAIVASVLDYTGPELKISVEPDPVGTSFAVWGDGDGHKTLLGMVERVKQKGVPSGMIVRAVLPYGVKPYPCELLLIAHENVH
ncbi:hypothetical protein Hypma_010936 [Hypsizygus marmoreus]|uniref:MYND-type domain-containing protein n=1 Tax=Hypsizygus marmoreus TaxID=39966 RepID=A0A369JJK2_HYPMA|nr:hypothetical protein Hypma_010936 [Hypsizygus marmoreus]